MKFDSRSATKSRERFITYIDDGINNLFDEVSNEYIVLNCTAEDITNNRSALMQYFVAFADIKKNKREVSSTSEQFEVIKLWALQLAAVAGELESKKPREIVGLLYQIFMKQIDTFIENFMPLATDWYSYTKSLFDQADGFNTWYRMYSGKDWRTQFAHLEEILKLYSEFN